MRVVNAYTIAPDEIQAGDVMLFIVKAMVTQEGKYRLYRCFYEGLNVPQGNRILCEQVVCQSLFPILAQVAEPDAGPR